MQTRPGNQTGFLVFTIQTRRQLALDPGVVIFLLLLVHEPPHVKLRFRHNRILSGLEFHKAEVRLVFERGFEITDEKLAFESTLILLQHDRCQQEE